MSKVLVLHVDLIDEIEREEQEDANKQKNGGLREEGEQEVEADVAETIEGLIKFRDPTSLTCRHKLEGHDDVVYALKHLYRTASNI